MPAGNPPPATSLEPAEQLERKNLSFIDYYLGTIWRPRAAFDALAGDERRLRFGIVALAINVQLYALVYVLLSIAGNAPSAIGPWLTVPAASYYHFNGFYLAPSLLICWILASGVAQLLSRAFSGSGSFEDMLGVMGLGISIACLPVLLIELPAALLGAVSANRLAQLEHILSSPGPWHEVAMLLYSLSMTWTAVLFCIGVHSAQRIRRGPAILIGMTAYVVYQAALGLIHH